MSNRPMPDDLERALDIYLESGVPPAADALTALIRAYPDHAQALVEFGASFGSPPVDVDEHAVNPAAEDALVRRGMEIVRGVRARLAAARTLQPAIASLTTTAGEEGVSVEALAAQTGLTLMLLRLLDRRLIRTASIPRQAVETIARAIHRDASAVAAYFQGPPSLAQGARYHAEHRLTFGEQQDFADAVRDDPDLSDEQRAYWLDLATRETETGWGE